MVKGQRAPLEKVTSTLYPRMGEQRITTPSWHEGNGFACELFFVLGSTFINQMLINLDFGNKKNSKLVKGA